MKKILLMMFLALAIVGHTHAQEQATLLVGDFAPDFTATDFNGEEFTLSEHFDEPVALFFYRGGWCLFCQKQLKEVEAVMPEMEDLGVKVVMVSVDKVEKSADTVVEHDLSFTLISDPEANIISDYGLRYIVPTDVNDEYVNKYNIDLEAASGRTDRLVSKPAVFLIDNGEIVFTAVSPDPKVRIKTDEIMVEVRRFFPAGN